MRVLVSKFQESLKDITLREVIHQFRNYIDLWEMATIDGKNRDEYKKVNHVTGAHARTCDTGRNKGVV